MLYRKKNDHHLDASPVRRNLGRSLPATSDSDPHRGPQRHLVPLLLQPQRVLVGVSTRVGRQRHNHVQYYEQFASNKSNYFATKKTPLRNSYNITYWAISDRAVNSTAHVLMKSRIWLTGLRAGLVDSTIKFKTHVA